MNSYKKGKKKVVSKRSLDHFFNAESVAVIGASKDPGKAGNQILKNMLAVGYQGKIYPVHPTVEKIFDLKCYPDLTSIPGKVELIVVVIPDFGVPAVMRQAARRGDVKAAIIIAAGFSETKIPERVELEKEVLSIAKEAGIRVFGPNCVGIINTVNHLDTTFAPNIRQSFREVSFISQSGATGASILMFAQDQPVPFGFNKWAHVGNMSDVDIIEILKYYGEDEKTKVIGMYMEGIENAADFLDEAGKISVEKPILILKVGRSEIGSKAAESHTGSLAGVDLIYDGVFRQTGITRVMTIEELLDTAKAFAMQPLPRGNRICVLTEAGGPGIICMDEIGLCPQVTMATLSQKSVAKLEEILPPMAIINRPSGYIDMSAAALEKAHREALEVVLADEGVDGVILITVPPTFLQPTLLARELVEVVKNSAKPVLTCLMAGEWVKEGRIILEENSGPTFDSPQRAARTMINMVKRSNFLQRIMEEAGCNES
jgi:acyl-CoA synthetase (NDP forming)